MASLPVAQRPDRGRLVTAGEPAGDDLGATAALLDEVFPGAGLGSERYLEWLYRDAPDGPAIERNVDDDDGRVGHYAVTPIALADPSGEAVRGALSLNTAVHARARGAGLFVTLAESTYDEALRAGVRAVVGVANASSTPGFVRRLGFSLVRSLPAELILPLPGVGGGGRDAAVTPALLASSMLSELEPLLAPPRGGLARIWTPESLSWRLAAPGRGYALHVDDEALAVSTVAVRGRLRIAVVCALFARRPLSRRALLGIVSAVCRHQHAPVAVRIGVNGRVPRVGLPLPRRLRESPLNLVYRDLSDPGRPPPPIARWEALDFDAF
jgi:GNAT superfamily N-acetyltransferase